VREVPQAPSSDKHGALTPTMDILAYNEGISWEGVSRLAAYGPCILALQHPIEALNKKEAAISVLYEIKAGSAAL
jgi:hypothetical protein